VNRNTIVKNAIMLCSVILFGFVPFSAEAQSVDKRLVGSWWTGPTGACESWSFAADGTGGVSTDCMGSTFKFTVANGKIKFTNAEYCDEEGCQTYQMKDLDYSFSADGKTLILGGKKLTSEPGGCC